MTKENRCSSFPVNKIKNKDFTIKVAFESFPITVVCGSASHNFTPWPLSC